MCVGANPGSFSLLPQSGRFRLRFCFQNATGAARGPLLGLGLRRPGCFHPVAQPLLIWFQIAFIEGIYTNSLNICGKVTKGPYFRQRRTRKRDEPIDVCGFLIRHIGSHRTTWRRFHIWVTVYDELARAMGTHLKEGDWVLVEGSLFERPWRGGNYYFKDGSQANLMAKELWAHSVDLIERPFHDYRGDDVVPVPRDLYNRWRAMEETLSRWDVPRDAHADKLKRRDIEDLVEAEVNTP